MDVAYKDSVKVSYGRNADKWGTVLEVRDTYIYIDYGGQIFVEGNFYQDAYWCPTECVTDVRHRTTHNKFGGEID